MSISLDHFLEQTATRGTWYGGGSAVALSCALSAALMEKLASRPQVAQAARTIRRRCALLVDEDARVFASIIHAMSRQDRQAVRRAMKAAIAVPREISTSARQLRRISRQIGKGIRPNFRVDLRCADALAKASDDSARALIRTNQAWLKRLKLQ